MRELKDYLTENFTLACSGGVDSMYLADELVRTLPDATKQLQLVYVNHAQRKKSAIEKDWKVITVFAEKFHIRAGKINLKIKKQASEAEMRKKRYDVLIENALKNQAILLTAHHQDDDLETVLFRLMRGSHPDSIQGISKMKWMKAGKNEKILLIRPLFMYSKEKIIKEARARKLKWSEDHTNQSKRYTRNQIRHDLIPLLDQICPNATGHILDFFRTIIRQNENQAHFIEKTDPKLSKGVEVKKMSFEQLKRYIDEELGESAQRTTKAHWENLRRQIELRHATKNGGGPRKSLQFPGGFEVYFEGNQLFWRATR